MFVTLDDRPQRDFGGSLGRILGRILRLAPAFAAG
jgi:hypothetical protein